MHLSCSSLCQGKMERRRRSNLCLYVGQSNPLFPGVQQMPELTSLVKPWQALLPWLLPTSRGPCSKASSSFLRALYWLQGQCLYKLMRNWAFSWGSFVLSGYCVLSVNTVTDWPGYVCNILNVMGSMLTTWLSFSWRQRKALETQMSHNPPVVKTWSSSCHWLTVARESEVIRTPCCYCHQAQGLQMELLSNKSNQLARKHAHTLVWACV